MMTMQLKPNRWSCGITSLAMAMGIKLEYLIKEIGHDGGDIIFPDLDEPMCRRGFHSQELIFLARKWGWAVTPIEFGPVILSTSGNEIYPVHLRNNQGRFEKVVRTTSGVLEGHNDRCYHAVNYRHGMLYDPDGQVYTYSMENCEARNFFGHRALVLDQIR